MSPLASVSPDIGANEATGSEAMRIDSSGNVAIGTTDTSHVGYTKTLNITSSNNTAIALQGGTSGVNAIFFGDGTGNPDFKRGVLYYYHSDNSMRFRTNDAERMRIDSSGKILIGKTASNEFGTTGTEIHANGEMFITRTGTGLNVNRNSSDGRIINILKDGTSVGDISSNSGSIEINSQGSSLKFSHLGTNLAFLLNTNFAPNADNAMDLGASSERFKDIYLSGGAFIGGTGTANKLEDYEEGTWTPGYGGTTGSTGSLAYNTQTGRYTKIGRFVSATGEIRLSNKGSFSGVVRVSGLPFAPLSGAVEKNLGSIVLGNVDFATGVVGFNGILASGSNLYINKTTDNAVEAELNTSNVTNTSNFYFNFTYTTAS